MNFRKSSKTALTAARVALLAGVAALGFTAPANAQNYLGADVTGGWTSYNGFTSFNPNGGKTDSSYTQLDQGALVSYQYSNGITGVGYGNVATISNGVMTFTNTSSGNTTTISAAGVTTPLFKAAQFGADSFTANSATFGGTSSSNQTSIDVNGNMTTGSNTVTTVNGALTANGAATFNGGVTVSGGTTTDTLTVTNGAIATTITPSGIDTGSIHVGGTLTANVIHSNTVLSTVVGADQVNTLGLNADAANFGVKGNTAIDAQGNVTIGTANKNANLTVSGSATVTGQANLNGGATVSNNLTVSGAGNGGPATNVDMGGNVVHDVAAPVLGTDAANKAYVDAGLNSANQRIDRANQGVAIAMAVQNPVLTGSDRFGVAVNFSDFAGNSAVGATAVGILAQNVFGGGEKFGLTGGFGTSSNQTAGRVGVQLTW